MAEELLDQVRDYVEGEIVRLTGPYYTWYCIKDHD